MEYKAGIACSFPQLLLQISRDHCITITQLFFVICPCFPGHLRNVWLEPAEKGSFPLWGRVPPSTGKATHGRAGAAPCPALQGAPRAGGGAGRSPVLCPVPCPVPWARERPRGMRRVAASPMWGKGSRPCPASPGPWRPPVGAPVVVTGAAGNRRGFSARSCCAAAPLCSGGPGLSAAAPRRGAGKRSVAEPCPLPPRGGAAARPWRSAAGERETGVRSPSSGNPGALESNGGSFPRSRAAAFSSWSYFTCLEFRAAAGRAFLPLKCTSTFQISDLWGRVFRRVICPCPPLPLACFSVMFYREVSFS